MQDIDLGLQQPEQVLQTLAHAKNLQHLLLLLQFERQMGGNGIGQTAGIIDAGQRGQDFRRNFLVEFHILVELCDQRAAHCLGLAIRSVFGRNDFHLCIEMAVRVKHTQHIDALRAFHEHLHRAVRQFEHLQNVRHTADGIQVIQAGIVFGRRFLRDQHDALAGLHGGFQRLDGLGAADKQRDDHMRKHHDIAQRQQRVQVGCNSV